MRTEDTGEVLFTIKGNPGELATVIIQKAGSQAYSASGRDVGQRCIMVCADRKP